MILKNMSLIKDTHFFVVAHPDDVELFMFRSLIEVLRKSENVVLITMTAGDDGKGYQEGKANAYWALRNLGHERALKYLIDRIQGGVNEVHKENFGLRCCVANDVCIYNMMLPDQLLGKKPGETCLSALDSGQINALNSLDKLQAYSRLEVIQLLRAIFKKHASYFGKCFLHITSEDLPIEKDHLDHKVVSRWAKEAFSSVESEKNSIVRYQTYMNYESPVNMDYEMNLFHAAIWGIYNSYILESYPDLSGRRQLPYIGKQYML